MSSGHQQQVQVWVARVAAGDLGDAARARLSAALDDATLARVGRMRRAEDRDRGLAAHALLRRRLGAELGVVPRDLQFATWCPSCGSHDHGKPYLAGFGAGPDAKPPVRFNLSHSGELVAVALAPGSVEVGVDVESVSRPVEWEKLRRSIFADSEWNATGSAPEPSAARARAWSRKEAAVKATGFGLSTPLRMVVVSDDAGRPGGWNAVIGDRVIAGWDLDHERSVAGASLGQLGDVLAGYAGAVAVDPTLDPMGATSMPELVVRSAEVQR